MHGKRFLKLWLIGGGVDLIEEAYADLHALQNEHWWYVGARYVYKTLIHIGIKAGTERFVLDVGSGTGGNLDLLGMYGKTVGVELSLDALQMTETKPKLGLVCASADSLPFRNNSFDIVTLFGLIEHMRDDVKTMEEAKRVCKQDGFVALLTSAIKLLWSHHDLANRHHRRYTFSELKQLHKQVGLEPLRISYQNFFTFLPTLAVRLWQRIEKRDATYDMGTPKKWINWILINVLKLEAWLISFISLPIGVDLVAVSRPRK